MSQITKEVIDIGFTKPVKTVVLSDGNEEVYIPVGTYGNMRINKGMNDAEIMAMV